MFDQLTFSIESNISKVFIGSIVSYLSAMISLLLLHNKQIINNNKGNILFMLLYLLIPSC